MKTLYLLALHILLCFPVLCVLETVPVEIQQRNILHDTLHALFKENGLGAASMAHYWPYGITRSNEQSDLYGYTSHMERLCSNLAKSSDRQRLLCCPLLHGGGLYLHNVKIERGKMIFFGGNTSDNFTTNADGTSGAPPATLPPIVSLVRRQKKEFQMQVEVRPTRFSQAKCTSYFNGTLHVMGHLTTQNLYHVLNDNVVPLLSLIVLDAFTRPELLYADRAMLTGFHPAMDREQVPHLAALLGAAVPKTFALGGSAEGVCFRRVAWGGGVKVMYQHLLGAVRRLSAALLREITIAAFNPPDPYPHIFLGNSSAQTLSLAESAAQSLANNRRLQVAKPGKRKGQKIEQQPHGKADAVGIHPSHLIGHISSLSVAVAANISTAVTVAGKVPEQARRPLNVVIYTRGSSGVGRTIQGEELLRDRLIALGARATICCDFRKITLAEQLGYAVHADAIVGLHGAGLINNLFARAGAITVELKTIYGYGLTLFAVSSEARQGSFIEINIKDYHIWGKPGQSRNRPIDEPLMGRITEALFSVLRSTESARLQEIAESKKLHNANVQHTLVPQDPEKLLSRAYAELEQLANKNFQLELFKPLQSIPALPRPRGDLTMSSYPTSAFESAIAALASAVQVPGSNQTTTAVQLPAGASKLDFLFHMLGPEISEVHAQCARLTVSGYWDHLQVTMKDVHERYCMACDLPTEPQQNPSAAVGSSDSHAPVVLAGGQVQKSATHPATQQHQQGNKNQLLLDGLLRGAQIVQQRKQNQQKNLHDQNNRRQQFDKQLNN